MSNITIIKVLEAVEKYQSLSKIAASLGYSKSRMSEILNILEEKGFVKSISKKPRIVMLTNKGRKLIDRNENSMGNIWYLVGLRRLEKFVFICKVVFRGFDFEGFRGRWVDWGNGSGYYNLRFDLGSIRVFRDGKAVIYLSRLDPSRYSSLYAAVFDGLYHAVSYLYSIGIVVDWTTLKQVDQEVVFDQSDYDNLVKKGKYSVDLARKAEGILNYLDNNAKAWLDRSMGPLEIETNDLEYTRRLLLMPEIIYNLDKKLAPILEELSNQIRLHLEVEERTLSTLEKLSRYIEELRDLQRRPSLFKRILNWFRRWFG